MMIRFLIIRFKDVRLQLLTRQTEHDNTDLSFIFQRPTVSRNGDIPHNQLCSIYNSSMISFELTKTPEEQRTEP